MVPIVNIPLHLSIIMDGNGRWAEKRKLPRTFGHQAGVKNIEAIIERCQLSKIKYLSLFVFSSENWNRSQNEVYHLMSILRSYLISDIEKIMKNNIRILFIGNHQKLSLEIQNLMKEIRIKSKNHTGMTLILAISYSGRDHIRYAANKMIAKYAKNSNSKASMNISKNLPLDYFDQFIREPNIPDPDLLIRTGGEQRISNFMLWHLAYTELYFSQKLWPDFTTDDLDNALLDFSNRNRRFGKEK